MAVPLEEPEGCGHNEEGEHRRGHDAAEHDNAHALAELRALPSGEHEGEADDKNGEGGHHDWPEPEARRIEEGLVEGHLAEALHHKVEVEDGVLG